MRGQNCIPQATEVEITFGRYVLPDRFITHFMLLLQESTIDLLIYLNS